VTVCLRYNKPRPESTPLPLEWRKLDDQAPFMKLLVVRAMRPDRMTIAMENYVKEALPSGTAYIECDAGKSFMDVLSASLDDAHPSNPIFFILSPGADPVHQVEILAKRNGVLSDKFHRVALGQGQDVVAISRLEIAHKEGGWVVLENIHLMPVWNLELEKKLDEYAAAGSHPDFRLFISAEPSSAIPNGVLERSIKLTNEPPQGLKQNLKRAFASFEKDEFEFKDPKVKSILFGLTHFHSVIIERIKFGAKGWNKAYPFNTGDLMCSATVLANYLEAGQSADKVPWSDLRYIFGDILYGGHITDSFDRLLCSEYLEFYGPFTFSLLLACCCTQLLVDVDAHCPGLNVLCFVCSTFPHPTLPQCCALLTRSCSFPRRCSRRCSPPPSHTRNPPSPSH
jgi:dynein heavy chain